MATSRLSFCRGAARCWYRRNEGQANLQSKHATDSRLAEGALELNETARGGAEARDLSSHLPAGKKFDHGRDRFDAILLSNRLENSARSEATALDVSGFWLVAARCA